MATSEWSPRLTRKQMEERRLKADELFEQGYNQNQVSIKLGVNRSSTCRWEKQKEEKGIEGLKARKSPGHPTKLNNVQKEELRTILINGALKCGYETDLWTLPRISDIIKKKFGIIYHPASLSRTLRLMNFSCQKPSRIASKRNNVDRQNWIEEIWEEDKKN
jgi:transposase